MAVRIRLTRVGATKRPAYRVIAIDKRRARDGRALEILGYYDPLTDPATVKLDTEKIRAWIGKGAQPSDMVVRLMRQAGLPGVAAAPTPSPPATKPTARKGAKAPRAAKAPAAPKAAKAPKAQKVEAAESDVGAAPGGTAETEPASEPAAADATKADA